MNGSMDRLGKTQIRLYTDWDSSVGWSWGITSTIKIFKTGYNDKKTQSIKRWLYEF